MVIPDGSMYETYLTFCARRREEDGHYLGYTYFTPLHPNSKCISLKYCSTTIQNSTGTVQYCNFSHYCNKKEKKKIESDDERQLKKKAL
jgi:hypothetical protein